MGYFGEGGGCFGVGKSKNVLCMHHHNVAYSSRCGKNMSRFVVPHGASVTGPEFTRMKGSRSEPSGSVYAMMTMGRPPWDALTDKKLTCEGDANMGDLGVHTSYSCLSHMDIGLTYGWWRGVNAAVWRGDTDKHCILCKLAGNSTTWNLTDTKGSIVYTLSQGSEAVTSHAEDGDGDDGDDDGEDGDDGDDGDEGTESSKVSRHYKRHMEKTRLLEMGDTEIRKPKSGLELEDIESTGNPKYVLKSWNFGANWTWIILPVFLQGLGTFRADPTNDTTLYGIAPNCIARSYDQAETWEYCWDAPGLVGSFKDLVIKDSQTMIVMRNGDVPLRTRDGGKTWSRLGSVQNIAKHSPYAVYSWSGKTLALSTVVGQMVIWISNDDGDTWVDESGDYTALTGGISQWYENTLYIHSLGQGISAKTFNED